MIHNALFSMPLAWWRGMRSSLRSKSVREEVFWREVVFLIKFFNFYQKKQLPAKEPLPHAF